MPVIKHNGYSAAAANVLTTGLNALADQAQAVSTSIDNSVTLDLYDDLELACTFASSPTANKTVDVYMLISVDGTNYGDGDASTAKTVSHFVGSFAVRNVGTAQRLHLRGVQLPPGKFEYQLINNSGVAFSASGHTFSRRPWNLGVG